MSDYLDGDDKFATTADCVGDHNCRVVLDQEAVCISCDASAVIQGPDVVRPDFVIASTDFNGQFVWLVVEMSTGQKRASTAHGQLRAGIAMLTQSGIPTPSGARLAALVLIPKEISVVDLQTLSLPKYRLTFAKRPVIPRLRSCGESLSTLTRTAFKA